MPAFLRHLRRGEFTFPAGQTTVTKSLTGDLGFPAPVNRAKTIDKCMAIMDASRPGDTKFCHQLTTDNQLTVERHDDATGEADATIGYQIAECEGDVEVYRGSWTWQSGSTDDIPMPAGLTVGRCWPIMSHRHAGSIYNRDDWLEVFFANDVAGEWTNLHAAFRSSVSAGAAQLEWRAVKWPDCQVRQYTLIDVDDLPVDTAISPVIADLNKAAVIATNSTTSPNNMRFARTSGHTRITGNNNVRNTRNFGTGSEIDTIRVSFSLMELTDGSVIQRIPVTFGPTDLQLDFAVTVDMARTIGWFNGGQGQGYNLLETRYNDANGPISHHTVLMSDLGNGQVRVRRLRTGHDSQGTLHLWQLPVAAGNQGAAMYRHLQNLGAYA